MFVGRNEILDKLAALWQKRTPSLVTVRGRRRIGKSTLIAEFAARTAEHFISIDGQAPAERVNNKSQLLSFVQQLSLQTGASGKRAANWLQAFTRLAESLPPSGRTVVLLDEISWMGGYDATFAGTLKIVWDKALKKRSDLIVVLCGSVSSWIAENILNGTGFVGRDSLDLVVEELPLPLCKAFWGDAAERTPVGEMLDFLSVTGGVPKYLEELNPALSSDENIRRLCFSRDGILFRDFRQMFGQIFGRKAQERQTILESLSHGSKSISELATALGVERNGHLGAHLEELELAGFIAKDRVINPKTGQLARTARYRLKDNYSRFWLHYIEPFAREIEDGLFQYDSLDSLKDWDTIKGLQFENLVVSNYRSLLPLLGIAGASLVSAAPYRRNATKSSSGVQIDLLLQTRTTAYIVEVKRRHAIGAEIVDEIKAKMSSAEFRPGTAIRSVLVYEGKLAPAVVTGHQIDFAIPASHLFN